MTERAPWKRTQNPAIERAAERYDDLTDVMLSRWSGADVAKADAAWSKLYQLLPDHRVSQWLDNLAASIADGTSWSPTFPVVYEQDAPVVTTPVRAARPSRHRAASMSPARERRAARYADVLRLNGRGARQMEIAAQLGISQACVSKWLREGIA